MTTGQTIAKEAAATAALDRCLERAAETIRIAESAVDEGSFREAKDWLGLARDYMDEAVDVSGRAAADVSRTVPARR